MIHHLVFIWLKEEGAYDTIAQAAKDLKNIQGVRNFKTAKAIKSEREVVEDSYHMVLSMQFDNQESLDDYLNCKKHQRFLALLKPYLEEVKVFDFKE